MNFANALARLAHAAEEGQRGMPKDRVNVSQRELRGLIYDFRRVDGEIRSYHAAAETEREKRVKATDALAASEARCATLAAEVAALREALKPFAEFSEFAVTGRAWSKEGHQQVTIRTWFGPSDFFIAQSALSAPSLAAEVLDRVRAEGFAQGGGGHASQDDQRR